MSTPVKKRLASVAACLIASLLVHSAEIAWKGSDIGEAVNVPLSSGAFIGGVDFTGAGEVVLFNGEAVVLWDGREFAELWRPPEAVYGAFVRVHGEEIYFGESTNGTIWKINIQTGTGTAVETVPFVFDLAFDPFDRPFVSAPSAGGNESNPRNGFYLVDFDPETAPDLIAEVPGYSGPLCFEPDGDLLVATAEPGKTSKILRFAFEDLKSGIGRGHLTEVDSQVVAEGLPSAYNLGFGPAGLLLATDSLTGAVLAVDRAGSNWNWAEPEGGFAAPTFLAIAPRGGVIGFINSDFTTFNQLSILKFRSAWRGALVRSAVDRDLPPKKAPGGLAFDRFGRAVLFNGEALVRYEAGEWTELWRPESPVFGSFVVIHQDTVYFGESTGGTIRVLPLSGGEERLGETLPFNYDLAFDPSGRAFASAPSPSGTFQEPVNGVYFVDFEPQTPPRLVIEVPGWSGPLAFAPDGDLYVATAPAEGTPAVLRFASSDIRQALSSGTVLTIDSAVVVEEGLTGAYDLLLGPFGLLFVSDPVTGTLWAVDPQGRWGRFVPAGASESFAAPTYLAYDEVSGVLGVVNSDFNSFNRLSLIEIELRFRRGFANEDESLDLADAVSILSFLFSSDPGPLNLDRLDVNDDGAVDVADPVFLLSYLFAGGPQPPPPFATPGFDPTPDTLGAR